MAKRYRRTREDIRRLIVEFKSSGLSQAAFSRQRGLNAKHLSRWIQREEAASPKLVEVKVKPRPRKARQLPPDLHAEVQLTNGRILRVPMDVEASRLARIASALEKRC